mgnify:FL=1
METANELKEMILEELLSLNAKYYPNLARRIDKDPNEVFTMRDRAFLVCARTGQSLQTVLSNLDSDYYAG